MKFSPISMLVGALLAAVVFLSMSQSSLQAPTPLRVEYLPHPRDIFKLEEGSTYVVPAGKVLVLDGAGLRGQAGSESFFISDGTTVLYRTGMNGGGFGNVPHGLTFSAGNTLLIIGSDASAMDAYFTAYLVNQ